MTLRDKVTALGIFAGAFGLAVLAALGYGEAFAGLPILLGMAPVQTTYGERMAPGAEGMVADMTTYDAEVEDR